MKKNNNNKMQLRREKSKQRWKERNNADKNTVLTRLVTAMYSCVHLVLSKVLGICPQL